MNVRNSSKHKGSDTIDNVRVATLKHFRRTTQKYITDDHQHSNGSYQEGNMVITAHEKMQEQTFQTALSPSRNGKNGLPERLRSIDVKSATKEPHLPSDFLNAPALDKKGSTSVGESSKFIPSLTLHNTNLFCDESYSVKSLAARKKSKHLSSNSSTTPPFEKELSHYGVTKSDQKSVSQVVSAGELMSSSCINIDSAHKRRPSPTVDFSLGMTKMSTEERAARLLTTLRTTEPEGQKAASVFVLQETSNKMGGKVNCSNQTPKEGERAASINFSNDVLRSEKCNSHQIPNRPNGDSSSKSSIPTGLPRKKKKAFSYLDSIDRVAMGKAHLSNNSEIQNVVDSVATLVANEIRFGDCWHFEGPRPHHLVVPPSIHRTSKMLKNGSKLVDTRKSLLFGVESSSEQIGALNVKVTHPLPWIHQTNITETDHVVATKSENTDNDDDKAAKKLKSCIALSVIRFATDIYYPHLISCKSRICSNSVASDRIMISTLLALREMMTMNADKLFSSFPKAKVSACAGAIIRSCAKKLVSITSNFSFENFLRACQGYDSHRADFRFALVEANAQSACILPDGGKPSTEENMFSRISFNRTRMSHPLVYSENVTKYESPSESTGIDKSYSLTSPSPSLCATFLIKTEQLNSDIKEIDNMLNKSCDETVNEKIYHERISYPEYLLFQQTFRRVKKRTYADTRSDYCNLGESMRQL